MDRAQQLHEIIVDADILGGIPVFRGTRVPVQGLFDWLEAGDSLDDFLESFPDVTRAQVVSVLEAAKDGILQRLVCGS